MTDSYEKLIPQPARSLATPLDQLFPSDLTTDLSPAFDPTSVTFDPLRELISYWRVDPRRVDMERWYLSEQSLSQDQLPDLGPESVEGCGTIGCIAGTMVNLPGRGDMGASYQDQMAWSLNISEGAVDPLCNLKTWPTPIQYYYHQESWKGERRLKATQAALFVWVRWVADGWMGDFSDVDPRDTMKQDAEVIGRVDWKQVYANPEGFDEIPV